MMYIYLSSYIVAIFLKKLNIFSYLFNSLFKEIFIYLKKILTIALVVNFLVVKISYAEC